MMAPPSPGMTRPSSTSRPDVREAVTQTILDVARKFPIIRFDAAMTLAKEHVQRLWFPLPGRKAGIPSRTGHGMTQAEFDAAMPHEFWREVDRVAVDAASTNETKYRATPRIAASTATRSTTSRQNSFGMAASNSACVIPCPVREGIPALLPGSGNHSRWMCSLASVMAASKRMIGNLRATSRMVWVTASRTSAREKSSCAVSFQAKEVPSLPW